LMDDLTVLTSCANLSSCGLGHPGREADLGLHACERPRDVVVCGKGSAPAP